MAFAITVKTESSDNYTYAFDGKPTQEEIIEHIKEQLGDEFEYVADYNWNATYDIEFKMKL